MRPNVTFQLKILLSIALLFIYCEYLIYYIVLYHCAWPALDPQHADPSIAPSDSAPVKAMLLADPHLLGPRHGHWFDKLRREWQMQRAFQTAVALHKPDIVFILGDLFDEGSFCSHAEFNRYVERFLRLFAVPPGTQLSVVPGNHDIGFHYRVSPYLSERFERVFGKGVQMISVRGNHFVQINSVALEGDNCFLCSTAEAELKRIEKSLNCAKGSCAWVKPRLSVYSRPIMLQHFPLYRESDAECADFDAAPAQLKQERFRERWDCLSRNATAELLERLKPRLAVSGHTHHGCTRKMPQGIEVTLPSFSWRNKENPNFGLAVFTPDNFAFVKCEMPREYSVIKLYVLGVVMILAWWIYTVLTRNRRYRNKEA